MFLKERLKEKYYFAFFVKYQHEHTLN